MTNPAGGPTANGIDISNDIDPPIDWTALKEDDGMVFAILKASDGQSYPPATEFWNSQYPKAQAAGLSVGAYHFFESGDTAQSQVDNFVNTVRAAYEADHDMMPPVLDLEKDGPDIAEKALAWLQGVEQALGRRPMVYTYESFPASNGMADMSEFAAYPLWIATAGTDATPSAPAPWSSWAIWQFSPSGNLDAVPNGRGNTDLDYIPNGDEGVRELIRQTR